MFSSFLTYIPWPGLYSDTILCCIAWKSILESVRNRPTKHHRTSISLSCYVSPSYVILIIANSSSNSWIHVLFLDIFFENDYLGTKQKNRITTLKKQIRHELYPTDPKLSHHVIVVGYSFIFYIYFNTDFIYYSDLIIRIHGVKNLVTEILVTINSEPENRCKIYKKEKPKFYHVIITCFIRASPMVLVIIVS